MKILRKFLGEREKNMANQTLALEKQIIMGMAEDAKTVEAKALLKCMDKLHFGLSASAEAIALKCFAKELITDELYQGMFEGEWKPEYLRANYFIDCVYNKLKQFESSDPGKIKTTISTLAEIIREDSALKHIAEIVGNIITSYAQSIPLHILYILMYILTLNFAHALDGCCKPLDVKKASDIIAKGLPSDLTRIASGALAKDIITFSECQACTQANANHEKRCMRIVLNSIFERVTFDGKNLKVFLEILKRDGKPISDYAELIGKYH